MTIFRALQRVLNRFKVKKSTSGKYNDVTYQLLRMVESRAVVVLVSLLMLLLYLWRNAVG